MKTRLSGSVVLVWVLVAVIVLLFLIVERRNAAEEGANSPAPIGRLHVCAKPVGLPETVLVLFKNEEEETIAHMTAKRGSDGRYCRELTVETANIGAVQFTSLDELNTFTVNGVSIPLYMHTPRDTGHFHLFDKGNGELTVAAYEITPH